MRRICCFGTTGANWLAVHARHYSGQWQEHRDKNNGARRDGSVHDSCTACMIVSQPHSRVSRELRTEGSERAESEREEAVNQISLRYRILLMTAGLGSEALLLLLCCFAVCQSLLSSAPAFHPLVSPCHTSASRPLVSSTATANLSACPIPITPRTSPETISRLPLSSPIKSFVIQSRSILSTFFIPHSRVQSSRIPVRSVSSTSTTSSSPAHSTAIRLSVSAGIG